VAALVVVGTAYVAAVDPNEAGHYPTCPFLYLTGYACPGCGTLRAVHDLATGHPVEALQRNPLAVLLIPVAVLALLAWVRRAALGRRRRWDLPVWLPWAFLALTVAFGVLRNLPEIGWLGP
jgi:hypothetical protein